MNEALRLIQALADRKYPAELVRKLAADAQALRHAAAVIVLPHPAQPELDLARQAQGVGDVARDFAVDARQRRDAGEILALLRRQRVGDQGVAGADVVAHQQREAGRIRGATGPAQEGHEARVLAAGGTGAGCQRQAFGHMGRADRLVGRLPHAEVADHGQQLDGFLDADAMI
ncbi:hypothetical protein LK542_23600 [Massilia sp. IC2-477]|uniref:hypothetical protein n=1 Tax=Massilia sp. IC2-477 TaxID=2887198 RepID=UPI001D117849|nr:hypothetical protein [Massilia sp. IC2-477]MCC2958600.1 hypothetical protein [Massilia sp. IC2-477]